MKIEKLLESVNIAEDLDEEQLIDIGNQVVDGYDSDLASRKPWEEDLKNWTELALQVTSQKTFPWPNAANIKYPLLATAAMQFAARAYPTLIPSNKQVVKCKVVGSDMDGEKERRAKRISTHMSYQLLDQMDDWEEDMDKLLIALPIAGTCFKKTYWDTAKQRNCSKLILPKTLVVNYHCRNLEDAERITETINLTKRKVKERQNQGIYLDVDLGDPSSDNLESTTNVNTAFQNTGKDDETTPYVILEQHAYLDLDDDGYSEPYIITVEEASRKVLRIVPRFSADTVVINEKKKVVSIEAIQYYTKYSFIPNPDGGFYDIGFGRLLGPLNNSANTIINQLVDAGSLSNLQAGFIGKGLRIKMGETRFQPGEWKAVNAVGDDLKKQIFPLPVREPSQVLFNLLDLLLKSGKELASVAEIFVGKMPGQNTPATTTMATIEQGMKVFTAVYKRVYRSLTSEFRKLYKLNREYMNPEEYISVLDEPIQQSDYEGSEDDIVPGADPTAVSSQEKQAKLQSVMQILQMGTIDPMWFTQQYLEAHEIPNAEKAIRQAQPQPDPKQEELKLKAQIEQQKAQTQMQVTQAKLQMEGAAQEQKMALEARAKEQELKMKQLEMVLKGQHAQAELQSKQQQHTMSLSQQADNHKMGMITQAQKHQQTMQQQKQANQQSKGDVKRGSNNKK
jgi:chaperonin GroES